MLPPEASFYEQRQTPAVVDVSVAQHDAFYLGRVERERLPVHFIFGPAALELPAVQEYLVILSRKEMA
jgi:hypothetical protein